MNPLIENLDKLHTTGMGAERIRRNLSLEDGDVMAWCRGRILLPSARMERRGKNWYVRTEGCVFTINASSYTVITAHRLKTTDVLSEEKQT